MKRIVNIIEGGDFHRFVSTLERYENPASAKVVYTTGHKAKGREHDQVVLCDDFPSHFDGGEWVGLSDMERNLLYVAVTRSMRVLEINQSVREATEYYGLAQAPSPDFAKLVKQESKMVNSIIHDEGLPF